MRQEEVLGVLFEIELGKFDLQLLIKRNITMAGKLTAAQVTELGELSNLEEQVIYICQKLDLAQTAWNEANPQFRRNAIEINADFLGNNVAVQIALPLESSQFAASSVDEAFPAAGPAAP